MSSGDHGMSRNNVVICALQRVSLWVYNLFCSFSFLLLAVESNHSSSCLLHSFFLPSPFALSSLHDPVSPLSLEVSPRRRILNVSRSVWKQANVASDLWEKLTARCVDRHRSDTSSLTLYILCSH